MNKIKEFLSDELTAFKSSVGKIEYLLWWAIRVAMIYALVSLVIREPGNTNVLLLSLNLLATFTVVLARIILFPKWLIRRLSFRSQTYLNIMIFIGSFLGQGMQLNHKITNYDKFLHFAAGAVVLLIGNELVDMFKRDGDRISPLLRTYTATGFSFLAIVVWEVFEFFVDYYWPESANQGYGVTPNENSLFFKIFGPGAQNENQWAVFDTNVDMFYAVIGCIPAAIGLTIFLYKKEKGQALKKKHSVTAV